MAAKDGVRETKKALQGSIDSSGFRGNVLVLGLLEIELVCTLRSVRKNHTTGTDMEVIYLLRFRPTGDPISGLPALKEVDGLRPIV